MSATAPMAPTLEEAWQICADLFSAFSASHRTAVTVDSEHELLFCLLGGFGITYEHNRSAVDVIAALEPFCSTDADDELRELLAWKLSQPLFGPPRRDCSLRRYRFPRRKADLIVKARAWVRRHRPLADLLGSVADERERRRILCDCPGIGPKSASWMLRNIGLAQELAILDVHVVRALAAAGRLAGARLPRDYELVETAFLGWCHELNAPPAAFDLFIWEWQRGSLLPA